MRQAIMKALSKDPEQRQATARQFFEEFTEGGRMTVESAAGSGGKTSTAAMEAAPDFSAGNYGPPPSPMGAAQHPAGAAIPVPPTTSGRQPGGGGKGLLIGLGALGAVLLVAMVVVALGSMRGEEDDAPPLELATAAGSTAPPVEINAQLPPEAEATTGGSDAQATEPEKVAQNTPPKNTQGSTTPKSGSGSTEKPKQTGNGDKSASGGDSPKPAGGACDACQAAARSGNFAAAASNFSSCTDPRGKQNCRVLIKSRASSAAQSAADSGNCAQVRAIIAATTQMGIRSGQLSSAAAKCP